MLTIFLSKTLICIMKNALHAIESLHLNVYVEGSQSFTIYGSQNNVFFLLIIISDIFFRF